MDNIEQKRVERIGLSDKYNGRGCHEVEEEITILTYVPSCQFSF